LAKLVCDRFDKDHHDHLLRKFFNIKQIDSVSEYLEKFDNIVHQMLAHDPKFTAATITNRFIDGLRDDIKAVVLVHRPGNINAASSIALLQEETIKDPPKREYKKNDSGRGFKYSNRPRSYSYGNNAQVAVKGSDGETLSSKKNNEASESSPTEDKAAALMAYRKARGLCYKCGLKWGPGHKCSNSVSLHVVEELWQMLQGDSKLPTETSDGSSD
jgi:hypothetical protein